MLCSHMVCAPQVEEEGSCLLDEEDLDEGAVVAALFEQEAGHLSVIL